MVKRKIKNKIIQSVNIILGALIFLGLMNFAFQISFLFGVLFFVGFIWETSSGRLRRQPFLAGMLFIGGLVIRIAFEKFLIPSLNSKTMVDLGIGLLLFLGIYFIGYKIKKKN